MLTSDLTMLREFLQSGKDYYSARWKAFDSIHTLGDDTDRVRSECAITVRLASGFQNALENFDACIEEVKTSADLRKLRVQTVRGIGAADREGEWEIRDLLREISTLFEHLPDYPVEREKPAERKDRLNPALSKEQRLEQFQRTISEGHETLGNSSYIVSAPEFGLPSISESVPVQAVAGIPDQEQPGDSKRDLGNSSLMTRVWLEVGDWILVLVSALLIAAIVLFVLMR